MKKPDDYDDMTYWQKSQWYAEAQRKERERKRELQDQADMELGALVVCGIVLVIVLYFVFAVNLLQGLGV